MNFVQTGREFGGLGEFGGRLSDSVFTVEGQGELRDKLTSVISYLNSALFGRRFF